MPHLKKPTRRNYQPPRKRKPTGNQAFLNTTAWRKTTKRYRQLHPLCEVSEAIGVVAAAQCTDHIIARDFGGSEYDPRNLMAMTKEYHDKKSGMETHGSFLATIRTPSGLIPADRQQVIECLTQGRGGGFEPDG